MQKILLIVAAAGCALVAAFGTPAAQAAGVQLAEAAAPTITPDDRILGKADAPITIFEYASLTCPHCAAFARETLPQLKAQWIDTGKAKLVFRDFPLDGTALKAAVLARCAPADKFYGFIEVLFTSQPSWAQNGDPTNGLLRVAKLGGLSDEQFQACMKNDTLQNQVLGSRLAGEKDYQIDSTPTFFINGTRVNGAQSYAKFDELLKAAAKS